jgi:hypothetical protein
MEDRSVKLLRVMQMHDRRFKQGLIGALFGPPIVPFVHVGVVEFIPVGLQLFPLNAGV